MLTSDAFEKSVRLRLPHERGLFLRKRENESGISFLSQTRTEHAKLSSLSAHEEALWRDCSELSESWRHLMP